MTELTVDELLQQCQNELGHIEAWQKFKIRCDSGDLPTNWKHSVFRQLRESRARFAEEHLTTWKNRVTQLEAEIARYKTGQKPLDPTNKSRMLQALGVEDVKQALQEITLRREHADLSWECLSKIEETCLELAAACGHPGTIGETQPVFYADWIRAIVGWSEEQAGVEAIENLSGVAKAARPFKDLTEWDKGDKASLIAALEKLYGKKAKAGNG